MFVLGIALGVCARNGLGLSIGSKLPWLSEFKKAFMSLSLETGTIRIANACVHVARAYMSDRNNIKREMFGKDTMRNAHSRATTDCD